MNRPIENKEKTENPFIWSAFQMFYLTMPLLILIGLYGIFNPDWEIVKAKPDWNFITLLFFCEMMRDGLRHSELKKQGSTIVESGIVFSMVFIALTSVVLTLSILVDSHVLSIDSRNLFKMQFFLFLAGLFLCWRHKYQVKVLVLKANKIE